MMKYLWLTLLGVALAGSADAGSIVVRGTLRQIDADGDGVTLTATNSDGSTSSFLDDVTIDRVTFDVTAGTTVSFDILAFEMLGYNASAGDLNGDGETTAFYSFIRLWDASNTILYEDNPEAPPDEEEDAVGFEDGSVVGMDSYLEYTFTTAGTYFLTISSESATDPSDHLAGVAMYRRSSFMEFNWSPYSHDYIDHGDWQLTLTPTNGEISDVQVSSYQAAAVPEPGALVLLGIGVVGVVVGGGRRWVRRESNRAESKPLRECRANVPA